MSAEPSWLELCRVQPRFNKVKGSMPQDRCLSLFIALMRMVTFRMKVVHKLSVWVLRARSYKTKAEA